MKNKVISFEKHKLTTQEKETLRNYELRLLMRRANAYLKINQVYHAKSDFEEALKIEPDNEAVKDSLNKIKQL